MSSTNTVLVADDSDIDRMVIESALQKLGYQTQCFDSGASILKAIMKSDRPLIALLDWIMPDGNGVDICRDLSTTPPAHPVYIIMLTGKTEKTDIAYALENGADDYIVKPFNVVELKARICVGIRLIDSKQRLIEINERLLDHTKHIEGIAEARAEQLIQADRLSTIGMLSAGIAHEINNPCSFIAVNIQTLEDSWPIMADALDENASIERKQKAYEILSMAPEIVAEMKNGVTRIKNIVGSLKTYIYPNSEKSTWFRVEYSVESALQLCANRLKYHITVEKTFAETPEVFGDRLQLEQVFVNLFTNAADAMEETQKDGLLSITTELRNDTVITYVRDTGPGISKTVFDKIFLPFLTTKPVGKGTGLGLSISRNIMKAHGGDLEAENMPGKGARFKVLMPVKRKKSP
jgi:two-component system, NtrC family, sensor kinase